MILSGSNLQYYLENTQDHVTSVPFSHLHFLIKKTIPLASLLEKLSSTETTASIENVSLNEVQCTSSMIMIKCYSNHHGLKFIKTRLILFRINSGKYVMKMICLKCTSTAFSASVML